MAKKQTFGDKVVGKDASKTYIKLIRSGRSNKTGALRFNEDIVQISKDKSADAVVKDLLSKKD